MSQYQVGQIRVENGSIAIRHIYEVNYTNKSGSFVPDESMSWPASTGQFVYDDTAGSVLYFFRLTGNAPAIGNTHQTGIQI
jgi:hypothetical protein